MGMWVSTDRSTGGCHGETSDGSMDLLLCGPVNDEIY
jgi:hypothetical protein